MLQEVKLFSVSSRTEMFKVFKGYSVINAEDYFMYRSHRTIRNKFFKISGKRLSTHEAKHFVNRCR